MAIPDTLPPYVDNSNVVILFKDLNDDIYQFADKVARSIARGDHDDLGASEILNTSPFPDAEATICFKLVERINRAIQSRIFGPFHPGADEALSERMFAEYRDKSRKGGPPANVSGESVLNDLSPVRQLELGRWRSSKFAEFEARFGPVKQVKPDPILFHDECIFDPRPDGEAGRDYLYGHAGHTSRS
jgi:hypothetical protein